MNYPIEVFKEIVHFIKSAGTTNVTRCVMTLHDMPTSLRKNLTKDECYEVLGLAKGRQRQVHGESAADQFIDDMMDEQMRPDNL